MRPFKLIAAMAVAAAIAVVVPGCGGDASAEEQWADSVCTDVGEWRDQVEETIATIQTELQSPGADTLTTIETAVRQAIDATREHAEELQALEAPDTEAGTQAMQQLDTFATQLESTATKVEQLLERVSQGANPVDAAQDLAALAPEVQATIANASSTLEAIQASGDQLRQGFEDADSCERFRSN